MNAWMYTYNIVLCVTVFQVAWMYTVTVWVSNGILAVTSSHIITVTEQYNITEMSSDPSKYPVGIPTSEHRAGYRMHDSVLLQWVPL